MSYFSGSTEQQYAALQAEGPSPLFAFLFYTAGWFAIEQRAIRNASGWALPETYLDEDSSREGWVGRRESELLHRIRSEHRGCSVVVLTDDIQSEKLSVVLPAARGEGDKKHIAHVVSWMRRREVGSTCVRK